MLELPSRSSRFLGPLVVPVLSLLAVTPVLPAEPRPLDGPISLFNGKDLTGWVNVNGAPKTWQVRDGMLVCTGLPTGFLRTDTMHENYVLDLEWRHPYKGSDSGLVVHADALPR